MHTYQHPTDGLKREPPRLNIFHKKLVMAVLVFWTIIGLIFSLQHFSLQTFLHSELRFSLLEALVWLLPQWYFWAGLTFFVLWMARRYPLERPNLKTHLFIHIFACIACVLVHLVIDAATQTFTGPKDAILIPFPEGVFVLMSKKLHTNIFIYWALVVGFHGFQYYTRARWRELETSRLQTELVRAQLDALKTKLHPHFLFNTLNGIGGMMYRDLAIADAMLVKLSHFLRMTLQLPQGQMTTLAEELAVVDAYLDIERLRFGQRLIIEREIDCNLNTAQVPVLLLQPLVENAIQHGIEKKVGEGVLKLVAKQQQERMVLKVIDNGPGDAADKTGGQGIGLGATVARLDRIYGKAYSLAITKELTGTFATLNLPLNHSRGGTA